MDDSGSTIFKARDVVSPQDQRQQAEDKGHSRAADPTHGPRERSANHNQPLQPSL